MPFDISGQVLSAYSNGTTSVVTITDGRDSLAFANGTQTPCQSGNIVQITGFVNRNPTLGTEGIFADVLKVLDNKPLPETKDKLSGKTSNSPFGQIQGVISHVIRDEIDANYNWIIVRTPYGELNAVATEAEYPLSDLAKLIDAEVILRGTVVRGLSFNRPNGLYLSLFGSDGIRILLPPRKNPFSAPHLIKRPSLHRQRIAGTVLAVGRSHTLVRTEDGRFLQASTSNTQTDVFHPGEHVTIIGFATDDRYSLRFTDALLRHESGTPYEKAIPVPVLAHDLFTDRFGHQGINAGFHGKTIRVQGILANSPADVSLTGFLHLKLGKHSLFVDVYPLPKSFLSALEPGMTLDVSGICLAEFETTDMYATFPSFRRFLIVLRSAEDLAILARPPWWTPLKLLVVIVLLALVIIAVVIWNRSLHILSERRGHALSLALTARVRAESRTQERTRLALELHDSISQNLTGVALQIDAATTGDQLQTELGKSHLTTAKLLLSSCRKELQDCLWDLRSRTFEEKDLTEAISLTLTPYLGKCSILARFNVPREALSESAVHSILNIIRELTANAIRHGRASRIHIAGEFKEGYVRFSVTDNGCGFDVTNVLGPLDGHFGLQGVRERVNDFNGTIDISSHPDKGTKVVVSFMPRLNETKNAQDYDYA